MHACMPRVKTNIKDALKLACFVSCEMQYHYVLVKIGTKSGGCDALQGRYEFLMPKHTSLRHRLAAADEGFVDFVAHLLSVDPSKRPTADAALQHPWFQVPYEADA